MGPVFSLSIAQRVSGCRRLVTEVVPHVLGCGICVIDIVATLRSMRWISGDLLKVSVTRVRVLDSHSVCLPARG